MIWKKKKGIILLNWIWTDQVLLLDVPEEKVYGNKEGPVEIPNGNSISQFQGRTYLSGICGNLCN